MYFKITNAIRRQKTLFLINKIIPVFKNVPRIKKIVYYVTRVQRYWNHSKYNNFEIGIYNFILNPTRYKLKPCNLHLVLESLVIYRTK